MSQLNQLAAALAKAQGEIAPAPKDADNPFFKSRYATLPAVREAMQDAFAKNGLSVVQIPEVQDGKFRLRTLLLHSSGQTLDCGALAADIDLKNPQKIGSAITYLRRYALAAVAQVVADEDDDGEEARKQAARDQAAQAHTPLNGHDVVNLQQQIQAASTPDELAGITRSDVYQRLKSAGPEDVYRQVKDLATAKHTLLLTEKNNAED